MSSGRRGSRGGRDHGNRGRGRGRDRGRGRGRGRGRPIDRDAMSDRDFSGMFRRITIRNIREERKKNPHWFKIVALAKGEESLWKFKKSPAPLADPKDDYPYVLNRVPDDSASNNSSYSKPPTPRTPWVCALSPSILADLKDRFDALGEEGFKLRISLGETRYQLQDFFGRSAARTLSELLLLEPKRDFFSAFFSRYSGCSKARKLEQKILESVGDRIQYEESVVVRIEDTSNNDRSKFKYKREGQEWKRVKRSSSKDSRIRYDIVAENSLTIRLHVVKHVEHIPTLTSLESRIHVHGGLEKDAFDVRASMDDGGSKHFRLHSVIPKHKAYIEYKGLKFSLTYLDREHTGAAISCRLVQSDQVKTMHKKAQLTLRKLAEILELKSCHF